MCSIGFACRCEVPAQIIFSHNNATRADSFSTSPARKLLIQLDARGPITGNAKRSKCQANLSCLRD
jgi:hypothetical protein